jgi:hypothetical protein
VHPSDEQAAFRGTIRSVRSRVQVAVVVAASVLVVGIGLLASLDEGGDPGASPGLPGASGPLAEATPRPTARPTPTPTPEPTLVPVAAPAATVELVPTGIIVADTGDPATGDLVADVDGTIWTSRAGAVVNVDPRTGRAREWTLADDPAFAQDYLVAARRGGVWLVGPEAIRLFDGEVFRAVIQTPGQAWSVVEAADGSLWAVTDRYGLIRWVDGVWSSEPPGRQGLGVADLIVDAEGRVWTADLERRQDYERRLGVSVWDGSAWTSFGREDLPDVRVLWDGWGRWLSASADGSVWVRGLAHLARFSEGRWMGYGVPDLERSESLSAVGDDGRLWFVREDCGPDPCGVRIHAYDGSTLTTWDELDGLPSADEVSWPGAIVLPRAGSVLVSTGAGLYRLVDGRWRRLAMSTPSGSPPAGSGPKGDVATIAAISRDEIWAVTQDRSPTGDPRPGRVYHFDGAAWREEQLPVEAIIGQAAVAPDAALWLATSAGPLVRQEGAWIDLGDTVASVAPDGHPGDGDCGSSLALGADGVAWYTGPRSAYQPVALRPVGGTWEATLHPAPPVTCGSTLAVTADGVLWLFQRFWGSTLARWDGEAWQDVPLPPVGDPNVEPAGIAVDPDGTLWVAIREWEEAGEWQRTSVWQVIEGRWVSHGGGGSPGYVHKLALLPDGSLIAVGDSVATFDGGRWHRSVPGLWSDDVSVAPDGAVWVAGPNVYRLPSTMP